MVRSSDLLGSSSSSSALPTDPLVGDRGSSRAASVSHVIQTASPGPQQREVVLGSDVRDDLGAVDASAARPHDGALEHEVGHGRAHRRGAPLLGSSTRTSMRSGRIISVAGCAPAIAGDRGRPGRRARHRRTVTAAESACTVSIVAGSRFAMPMKPATKTDAGEW